MHLYFIFTGVEGEDSTVAPRKSSGQRLGRRVMALTREAGCVVEAVVMKSDN